ncbi:MULTISPECIES: hypothetical protein [unclassified Brevundimonas]|jgi:uncharacterized protein YjbJ (UPF0337 family)|uniref:hypothetical protein n=1 Tax=unclassified Brevundimonas TaxID=2622653 RepID=UPI0015BCCC71|nr:MULTISPECIES: hypothetical protein [unclassified Brevundimonas]MDP3403500.1 hypothetical protein [Brevundimonas sp.]NWE52953.1 hypothetical protein [Brevundimonas sp. P7753]
MVNKHEVEGQWKIISGRIHKLWSEAFNDRKGVIEGELTEITGVLQREFGLSLEQAGERLERWRADRQPQALIEAQWLRFNAALQDRWGDLRVRVQEGQAEAQDLLESVETDAAELTASLQQRYELGRDEALAQVRTWLAETRHWIEANRPSRS